MRSAFSFHIILSIKYKPLSSYISSNYIKYMMTLESRTHDHIAIERLDLLVKLLKLFRLTLMSLCKTYKIFLLLYMYRLYFLYTNYLLFTFI